MHAVVPIEDSRSGNDAFDVTDTKYFFSNYVIWIGNDPDYTKNKLCKPAGHLSYTLQNELEDSDYIFDPSSDEVN